MFLVWTFYTKSQIKDNAYQTLVIYNPFSGNSDTHIMDNRRLLIMSVTDLAAIFPKEQPPLPPPLLPSPATTTHTQPPVAMTRGWQMGTDDNQLRQWRACGGVGGAVAVQHPHGSIVGARGGRRACCGVGGVVVGRPWR